MMMSKVIAIVYALGWVLALFVSYQVIRDRRSPTSTVAWIAVVFFLPFVGALFYLLIGVRKLHRPKRQRIVRWPQSPSMADSVTTRLEGLLHRLGASPATSDNEVKLHFRAQDAREALVKLIDGAQQEIWGVIYIFQTDKSGEFILQRLTAAAQRGVKVKLLVDDIGSFAFRAEALRNFKHAGGEINAFKPIWKSMLQRVANLRNHRKIFCADAAQAWIGGRNIGDEYLADHAEESRWIDVSVSVNGSASRHLEAVCRSDWAFTTHTSFSSPPVSIEQASEALGAMKVQIIASGPERQEDVWHCAFLKACYDARKRLYIATPYFVPDEAAFKAIAIAARNDVDIRIVVPEQSDSRMVDIVSVSYLRELQRMGVKVSRFGKMMHAKYVLVDDDLAFVGSANIDARSFYLNYEVMALVFEPAINQELSDHFAKLEARATHDLPAVGIWNELMGLTLRILAPML